LKPSYPSRAGSPDWARDGVAAGLVAAAVSGIPSTVCALVTGRDPLEATLAAGSLLLPGETRRSHLVVAAGPVHLAVSLGWALVLVRALPRRPGLGAGVAAGLAIAALDLGVIGRRFPRVRALPSLPQLLDHAVYGVTVAAVLRRRSSCPRGR
jgi:hypothetical protein